MKRYKIEKGKIRHKNFYTKLVKIGALYNTDTKGLYILKKHNIRNRKEPIIKKSIDILKHIEIAINELK